MYNLAFYTFCPKAKFQIHEIIKKKKQVSMQQQQSLLHVVFLLKLHHSDTEKIM